MCLLLLLVVVVVLPWGGTVAAAGAPGRCTTSAAGKSYAKCIALPTQGATLAWTYDPRNATLDAAFTGTFISPSGWVAWGVNQDAPAMAGARVIAAFSDPSTGALLALPFVLSPDVKLQAKPLVSRPLDIVPLLASSATLTAPGARSVVRDGASVAIAVTIRLSPNRTRLHFVWNRGLYVQGYSPTIHRGLGIAAATAGSLQTLAVFFRPKTTNRYRKYWKSYHHLVGYGCVVVGVVNVFQGFEVMGLGESFWKLGYCVALASLVGACVALEVNAWVVFCRRQQEEKLMRRDVEDVVAVKDRAAAF